jgi:transposase
MQLRIPLRQTEGHSDVICVNARVQVHCEDEVRVLVVSGIPLLSWTEDDGVGESFATVLLVQDGFASPTEVARAFDCSRMTVYRNIAEYEGNGIEGLVPEKRGPKRPRVLRDAKARRMLALKRRGESNAEIGRKLGVSEAAVRKALQREGVTAGPKAQLGLPLIASANDAPAAAEAERAPAVAPEAAPAGAADAPAASEAEAERTLAVAPEAAPAGAGCEAQPDEAAVSAESQPVAGVQVGVLEGDPWDRSDDRLWARLGLLSEALPQFGRCENVLGLGALLAMPALVASGLFEVAAKLYVGPAAAFYGVRSVFACLSLMALLRIKRPEQLRHTSPPDLGRLLGLDRAPEVKTLRNRLDLFSSQNRSERFQRELARRRVEAQSEAMGFLYVDGHVRVYNGDQVKLTKAHVTRMRLSMPATVDHWVNDRDGDPLFVVTATPTAALAKELPAVLKEVRAVIGERTVTVVFDRGGWSPKLFAQLVQNKFDLITYRKGAHAQIRRDQFSAHTGIFDGRKVTYQLAERVLVLKYQGGSLTMREIVRLSEDGDHQTSIVTNRKDLSRVEIAYRMFERWRQENFGSSGNVWQATALSARGKVECHRSPVRHRKGCGLVDSGPAPMDGLGTAH